MSLQHLRVAGIIALVAGCAAVASDDATSIETTLRDIDCKSCRIAAESVAFLGHPDDTVAIAQENLPAVDSRGRFYLASGTGGSVLVFGPNGRLMSSFGKAGSGPGEFARVSEIYVARGDTLIVVGSGTVHVISPDYEHIRQFAARVSGGGGFQGTLLSDGRLLRAGGFNAFTIVDEQGSVAPEVRLQNVDTTRCMECGERAYREARDGDGVWSGPTNAYRVDLHTLSGELVSRFTREANWFEPWMTARSERSSDDPASFFANPRLMGVRQGSDGVVYTHVMMMENTEGLRKEMDFDNPRDLSEILSRIVTRVEAIDPEQRKLLATTTLPYVTFPLTGDYSAALYVDPSGDWAWKIVKFRIEGLR